MTDVAAAAMAVSRNAYPVKVRRLRVTRTQDLSPTMRRIVVGGDELEPTLPAAPRSVATHVKVVIPSEASGEVTLPALGERGVVWPGGSEPDVRDYTVRAFDAERGELSLDFVLHEHGPAGRWAMSAKRGDQLGVMGPRGYTIYSDQYARYVIGCDESGLPATERWIEEAPQGAVLDVFVLVAGAASKRQLPNHPGLRLHWVHRRAGGDLATAVSGAVSADDGTTFVWVAGEAASVQPLRRYLRDTAGFAADHIDVHGYWKRDTADDEESHGHHERRKPA